MWILVRVLSPRVIHSENFILKLIRWLVGKFPNFLLLGQCILYTHHNLPQCYYWRKISICLAWITFHVIASCNNCDGLMSHSHGNSTSYFLSHLVQAIQFLFYLWNYYRSHILVWSNIPYWCFPFAIFEYFPSIIEELATESSIIQSELNLALPSLSWIFLAPGWPCMS